MNSVFKALVITTVSVSAAVSMQAQARSFTVTVVPPVHGTRVNSMGAVCVLH